MHLYARRALWFAGLWLASVLAVGSVGYLIKLVIS
jgi:hypothetical protein